MKNNLFYIVLALSPWVMANQDDVQIERIYTNTAAAQQPAEAYDGVDNSGSGYGAYGENDNDSRNSKSSPQVNIYNANTNKNENDHKQSQVQDQDQDLDASLVADAESEAIIGQDHIKRANEMRKARKHMEVGTEQKMIEKIEYSRMEDEKARADRLFGNRLDKDYNQQPYQQPYQPAPAYQEPKKEETKVIIVEKEKEEKYDKKDDDYADDKADDYVSKKYDDDKISYGYWGEETYISPMIGTINYDAVNTSEATPFGVALGTRFASGMAVEGSFMYSSIELDDYDTYLMNAVDQYTMGVGVKYNFQIGRVSPHVGALLTYTYREYGTDSGHGYQNVQDSTSTAFDAGVSAGVDVRVAKNFTVGAEYRLMKNISYSRDGQQFDSLRQNSAFRNYSLAPFGPAPGVPREPLEEVGQQVFLINGKFTF